MSEDPDRLIRQGSLADLRGAILARRISAVEALRYCLGRIEQLNRSGPGLNAVRSVSGSALADAERLDALGVDATTAGALHGIPVLLKDNIATADGQDMTAGAAALKGFLPRNEAALVTRLRRAGAIILGKCNMTEFADYVSDVMPSGFSGAGGMVRNPHGGAYGRGGGSSVGSAAAVAAGIVPLAFGSETQNSIQTPACNSSLVGFKPSVGRVSRSGIVPLVPSQDSPGPLTRSVADARLVYDVIAGPDPADTMSLLPERLSVGPGAADLPPGAIRLGVPRIAMADRDDTAPVLPLFEAVLSHLARSGIGIVDPCDLPSAERLRDLRSSVFPTEFKAAINHFLAANDRPAGIGSLEALIAWNEAHPDAIPYGQPLLLAANATAGLDGAGYHADRVRDIALSRQSGIDGALAAGEVDALIFPMTVAAKCTGKAGAPVIAIPAGIGPTGAPFGITLTASWGQDRHLLAIASAVERLVGDRRIPAM